jgi:hypothetical protein
MGRRGFVNRRPGVRVPELAPKKPLNQGFFEPSAFSLPPTVIKLSWMFVSRASTLPRRLETSWIAWSAIIEGERCRISFWIVYGSTPLWIILLPGLPPCRGVQRTGSVKIQVVLILSPKYGVIFYGHGQRRRAGRLRHEENF